MSWVCFLFPMIAGGVIYWMRKQLLARMGTKLCEICDNEIANFSHPSDSNAKKRFCSECLTIWRDDTEGRRDIEMLVEDVWQMMRDVGRSLLGSTTRTMIFHKKRTRRKKSS